LRYVIQEIRSSTDSQQTPGSNTTPALGKEGQQQTDVLSDVLAADLNRFGSGNINVA